jgi:hypothetical protein
MTDVYGTGQYVFLVCSNGTGSVMRDLRQFLPTALAGIIQDEGRISIRFLWERELDPKRVKGALIFLRRKYPGLKICFSTTATLERGG